MTVAGGNKNSTFDWTAERIAELRTKWESYESASDIASHFSGLPNGPSRSAVIGKVHRLKLEKRRDPWKRIPSPRSALELEARAERERQRLREKYAKRRLRLHQRQVFGGPIVNFTEDKPLPQEPPPPVEFFGIALLDLNRDECRYPRGEGASVLFCGQPQIEGSSYCRHCHSIVYAPSRPDRRKPFIPARGAAV